jgi:Skp family chaperone for outer membrane proteins
MLLVLASGFAVQAAELKIGVLDFQALFKEYEGFDEAQTIFEKDMEAWQAQKQQMVQELLERREQLEVQRPMLLPETFEEMQAEVSRREEELYRFEQDKFGPEGEAVRRNNELSEPIIEKIRATVKTVAEEDGYDLVLDTTGVVLYVRPEMNMDEKVKAALKAKG